jgi:hypothetical protein
MISSVLINGEQPILTDVITSTVLQGAFAVDTVSTRYDARFSHINVEKMLAINSVNRKKFSVATLLLLLEEQAAMSTSEDEPYGMSHGSITDLMFDLVTIELEENKKNKNKATAYRYTCLINLHGFTPSWVPVETAHWSTEWAEPALIYEYHGTHGKEMEALLRANPPEKCMVYF